MKMFQTRLSKTGLSLCAVYVLLSAAAVVSGLLNDDPEGRYINLWLPLAPIAIPIELAFLSRLRPNQVPEISFVVAYAVIFPILLGLLYLIGVGLGKAGSWTASRLRNPN
jgi:hypothetical protein